MEEKDAQRRVLEITAASAEYCRVLETARNMEAEEFINDMVRILPRLYIAFTDFTPMEIKSGEEEVYFSSYVDEDYYESIRRNVESILGPNDTFLETFEEDMKYSDTPIASSVSECLADIFQPLFNFVSIVRDSDGESALAAYAECQENFTAYWSQTLCNVMRALNHLKYS